MPPPDQALWFAETVRPHEPALRAFLPRRFSSLPDHDDLIQETYARLLRVSDPARLVHARAFLFTTARNVAIDHFRRLRRTPVDSLGQPSGVWLWGVGLSRLGSAVRCWLVRSMIRRTRNRIVHRQVGTSHGCDQRLVLRIFLL